jgi:cytochrome c oxidase cbb3-type subunit I/II
MSAHKTLVHYNDKICRYFLIAGIIWAIVGTVAGALIASQLAFYQANFDTSWLTFGRLRPLHTNAAIFAFVGNMMFSGIYYSTQRLCRVRLASDRLSWAHFILWQLIIIGAAATLPLGLTRSKEYAEMIWPLNILVAITWVIFAINFFATLARRNERSMYVALWFYIATVITIPLLYIVNHLSLPTSLTHSYPIFAGVQDALIQWWYGHNAVAFFLTTPILGIMYYFLPKAANRPVYSYKLSIVHFWGLVFIYIWAGPHHLLNTALPSWLQGLGMIFSLMLWAPSWGGMLNGLLTLRGGWNELRKDPVIKFFVAGVTFYGMATLEGPLLAIKSVNALSHYTDWTIGHVHSGTLGWNGLMAAGMFYWMAPRLWGTKLYSKSLANLHFWLAMIGILLYIAAMWVAGIGQGLMLNGMNEEGTLLAYPNFLETVIAIRPMMHMRLLGGLLYVIGFILLAYNIYKTARSGKAHEVSVEVTCLDPKKRDQKDRRLYINAPLLYIIGGMVCLTLWMFTGGFISLLALFGAVIITFTTILHFKLSTKTWSDWYNELSANYIPFTVLTFVAIAIGGIIQILPTISIERPENMEGRVQVPFTPLELAGRDIYISEGCYNCHSQMIRTMVPDVIRYGDPSHIGESIYDYPFQWGSKRTGPDLARVGGKYPDLWHYRHMLDPRSTSPGSNMPNYPWLFEEATDVESLPARLAAQRTLGVPYPEFTQEELDANIAEQSQAIVKTLKDSDAYVESDKKIVALIAYLQALGKRYQVLNEGEGQVADY